MATAVENQGDRGDPAIAIALCAPPADEILLQSRLKFLHQLVSGLQDPPQTLETAFTQMATALISQTNEHRLSRELKAATETEPKVPSQKFTVTLPVLLEYLQIPDEQDLPAQMGELLQETRSPGPTGCT